MMYSCKAEAPIAYTLSFHIKYNIPHRQKEHKTHVRTGIS